MGSAPGECRWERLQLAALDGKADDDHSHAIADVTNLQTPLACTAADQRQSAPPLDSWLR
jgi:hypothetical protein